MENIELKQYIQTQIAQSAKKLQGMTRDAKGESLFKRRIFLDLQKYIENFLKNRKEPRIIVMPGLRGTGKTTLLAQLFMDLPDSSHKIYLSIDEVVKRFGGNLWDVIACYEELISTHIEELNVPLFLFFDEIHYDEKWAMFLKTMYDRGKNIMIFCTGSASLLLKEQINADVARRVLFINIHPVCFSEYMLFKFHKTPIEGLDGYIRNAVFFSDNAAEVFEKLQNKESEIKGYWLDISKFEIQRYVKTGTFPFTLSLDNEILSMNFVGQIINKIIYMDIPQFFKFEVGTLNRIDKALYLISDTLGVSLTKLCDALEIKIDTLRLIFKALEQASVITRVAPHASNFKQAKKPSKYLFSTPSLRYFFLSLRESIKIFDVYQGNLLEDIVGMYLIRIWDQLKMSLTYDASKNGADFILSLNNKKIVIEVGAGKKDFGQIINTSLKVNSKYNLIISNEELEYSKELNAVKLPLKYFLLL